MDRFEECFPLLLKEEGGYVNHPADPGGITNLGVTKRAWESWVGHSVTEEDMKALTPEVVKDFYRTRYWEAAGCHWCPTGVDRTVFDHAVNAGHKRAIKMLQECLEVQADGLFGNQTRAAFASYEPSIVIQEYAIRRRAFYRTRLNFNTFGRGWLNRVQRVEQVSLGDLSG